MREQKRISYSFWQALGDIGGFHDGLCLLVAIVMRPFSANNFQKDVLKGSPKDSALSKKERYTRIKFAQTLQ